MALTDELFALAKNVDQVLESKLFKQLQAYYMQKFPELIELLCKITKIPSPTFQEDKKADFVKSYMLQAGLKEVTIDHQKNVIGRYPGSSNKNYLPIFAHIDTVFPFKTKLNLQKNDDEYSCPGIGDNSASVAVMLTIIKAWRKLEFVPIFDVIFVASSCEEGLGDLKGIKYFFDNYVPQTYDKKLPYAVLALDGTLGDIIHIGVGSKRVNVTITSPGGHSWGNFGNDNAIHLLSRCISDISHIEPLKDPKTTYNVGTITGGTSVNTIAPFASCLIDMRSINQNELDILETKILKIINTNMKKSKSTVKIESVGDRPGAILDNNHPIVKLAEITSSKMDLKSELRASSTDTNIPLSKSIPAITIGVYYGEGAHTIEEKLSISSLKKGIAYSTALIMVILKWGKK